MPWVGKGRVFLSLFESQPLYRGHGLHGLHALNCSSAPCFHDAVFVVVTLFEMGTL